MSVEELKDLQELEDKLASVRDELFDADDFVWVEEGFTHDMTSDYMASPYSVLCAMERKIKRLLEERGNAK